MSNFFNTLNDFFNSTNKNELVNKFITTGGYSTVNDGGAGTYYVTQSETSNNDSIVISGNSFSKGGFTLELMFNNGEVNVEQFGAMSTALAADNKSAIQAAIDSGARRVNFRPTRYNVGEDILVNHPIDIVGNGAELVLMTDSTSTQLFRVEYGENVDIAPASIRDMKIVGTRVETQTEQTNLETNEVETIVTVSYYNDCIKIVNASDFTVSNICFEYGAHAVFAQKSNTSTHVLSNICVKNCNVFSAYIGVVLRNVSRGKVENCKIDLNNVGLTGLSLRSSCTGVNIEDVSIFNCEKGIEVIASVWNNNASERCLFKNVLVDCATIGVEISNSFIPVHFVNAMFVNIKDNAIHSVKVDNVSFSNSSIVMAAPGLCADNAMVLYIQGATKMKFTHVQFEFPFDFQYDRCIYAYSGEVNISLVDCTLQKTDNALENPRGFGTLGCRFVNGHTFIQTFDACEFRSYIKNYSADNMPFVLAGTNSSDYKLIIKNCRFVNENTCTVPYFQLDDSGKFDNIVVYNCFFENYDGTESSGSTFPIFGRLVNGSIETSNKDSTNSNIHNIFAKCNMRSSKPDEDRTNGTTINAMQEYI